MRYLLLLGLLLMPVSAMAFTINAQPYTTCGLMDCSTCVNLEDFNITSKQITTIKGMDLTAKLPKIVGNLTNIGYGFNGSTICITGKIKPASTNYWTMDLGIASIDPWWSSSWTNCKNVSIDIYQTETSLPITANFTGLILTNYYEPRLMNGTCNEDNVSEINYTVLDYRTNTASSDWIEAEFPFTGSNNETWSLYYNNPTATDPSYLFTLFHPNMTDIDWINEWHSDDTAKYTMISGHLNASRIDTGQYNSDQLQTKNDYSSYANITLYDVVYDQNSANNKDYNRYMACTNVSSVWDNDYNLLTTNDNPDEFRVYYLNPAGQDIDSGLDIPVAKNFSVKVWYTKVNDDAMLWIRNTSVDTSLYSLNKTDLAFDCKFWGVWTDSVNSQVPVQYYAWKIYLGYVNPREINLPTITLSGSQEAPPVALNPVIDGTVVCFKTQPVCINLKDDTLIYKGKGYYE